MTSLGGLLARADLAADVRGRARQLPLVLHVRGEVRGQLDGAAVVAEDELLINELLALTFACFMAQAVAAAPADQIGAQSKALHLQWSICVVVGRARTLATAAKSYHLLDCYTRGKANAC